MNRLYERIFFYFLSKHSKHIYIMCNNVSTINKCLIGFQRRKLSIVAAYNLYERMYSKRGLDTEENEAFISKKKKKILKSRILFLFFWQNPINLFFYIFW